MNAMNVHILDAVINIVQHSYMYISSYWNYASWHFACGHHYSIEIETTLI